MISLRENRLLISFKSMELQTILFTQSPDVSNRGYYTEENDAE